MATGWSARRARWGLFLTSIGMGIFLVGSAISGYRSSSGMRDVAALGQGTVFLRLMRVAGGSGALPLNEQLDHLRAKYEEEGLRYYALVGPRGELLASTGESSFAWRQPTPGGPGLEWKDHRVRMVLPAPPSPPPRATQRPREETQSGTTTASSNPEARAAADGVRLEAGSEPYSDFPPGLLPPPDRLPPHLRARFPGPPPLGPRALSAEELEQEEDEVGPSPAFQVVEFEPTALETISAQSMRILFANTLAALALLIVASVFWLRSVRLEAQEAQQQRQAQLAALGETSAVLAHEIRNPLASLKGHAQLLLEGLTEGSREWLKARQVEQEAIRLEKLANDLLDFVKLGEVELELTDPAELLRQSATPFPEDRVELLTEAAPIAWPLDASRMQQVLVNLLQNGLEASDEGKCVSAEVRLEGEQLLFRITDRGAGIPAGEEERIFEPFRTSRVRGVGLGLAVSRRIVSLHRGTIQASNGEHGGAVFEVRLPRAE